MVPRLVETRRDLHRHPELSNREERTGKLVAERLRAARPRCALPGRPHGVVGVLVGGRPTGGGAGAPTWDPCPSREAGHPLQSENAGGMMHACGHDAHTAMLLGPRRSW